MGFFRTAQASFILVAGFISLTHASTSFTGAEFTQADKPFSQGYAWGVLEQELAQFSSDSTQRRARKLKLDGCLVVSPISAEMLDTLVRTHINASAERSREPALRSVLNVLAEICDYNR
jgi:hypothetical protein